MLTELQVKNFSLLRDLKITFSSGLNILTGPSGAGKTLVLDAISFILGKRPNQTIIGQFGDRCCASAEFRFASPVAEEVSLPERVALERTFSRAGRSFLTLNGQSIKVSELSDLFAPVVDISSQFAQQQIFRAAFHRELLDAFGDAGFKERLSSFGDGYSELKAKLKELALRREALRKSQDERSYLEFQIAELSDAKVAVGEKQRISTELYMQEHAEEILQRVKAAARLLYEDDADTSSAFDLIARASDELSGLASDSHLAAKAEGVMETLASLMEEISEANRVLGELAEVQEYSPEELESLKRRMDEIQRLEHKYGVPADELPRLLEEARDQMDALSATPEQVEELQSRVDELSLELLTKARQLNESRRGIARKLEEAVHRHLERLGFPDAQFMVDISEPEKPDIGDIKAYGLGHIEYIICLNPGEPARPLAEVASGGEAARLLLSVKAALQEQLSYTTIVFDEIEAGVGGDAAFNVASVLKSLAAEHQVIAVTHLAAVASAGERHLDVMKTTTKGETRISVKELAGPERIRALARMLGDDEQEESLALAEEFLRRLA